MRPQLLEDMNHEPIFKRFTKEHREEVGKIKRPEMQEDYFFAVTGRNVIPSKPYKQEVEEPHTKNEYKLALKKIKDLESGEYYPNQLSKDFELPLSAVQFALVDLTSAGMLEMQCVAVGDKQNHYHTSDIANHWNKLLDENTCNTCGEKFYAKPEDIAISYIKK